MQNTTFKTFFLAALLLAATVSAQAAPSQFTALMPRVDDYTLMWWAEGIPTRVPNAPWRRVTQTGRYALALDTETLRIPHFGAVPGTSYESAGRAHNRAWQSLPPGVTRLEPGDFIDVTVEHIIMPQFAADYYGPNTSLRAALNQDQNTWRMIQREAIGNDRRVNVKIGKLGGRYPAVKIGAAKDVADLTLKGGLGYIPITFTGLTSPRGHQLLFDGKPVNQSVHGNDFWQTDFDVSTQSWSLTYNIPISDDKSHTIRLTKTP